MMRDAILNFSKQFSFQPEIINGDRWRKPERVIVAGMGGSALAADLLTVWKPELSLVVHRNYGLPRLAEADIRKQAVIAVSYSGNTEETLSSAEEALRRDIPLAAVSVGGKLIDVALRERLPHVLLPNTGIQPRSATGLMLAALLALLDEREKIRELSALGVSLNPKRFQVAGEELARSLRGTVPVVYASAANAAIAWNWKIKFNETGKIPAFSNSLPEANHNEMTAFDGSGRTAKLGRQFSFILLEDEADDPRIKKRMAVLRKLFEDRKLPVHPVQLSGSDVFKKMFSSFLLADWAAYYTAEHYGADSEQVPMVEEFKKFMSQ